jgi:deoxyadenosine/deoxycytidine kinase
MIRTELTPPGYLVVEGPIGVGKTSLVNRLADSFGCETLLERPDENPFLERFYQDTRKAAFPTQLFFLFQRSQQLQELGHSDLFRSTMVADFMLEKDRIFAGMNLDKDELELYEKVYSKLNPEAPVPDLVVYLQAPAEVLQRRVRGRSRPHEMSLSLDYLQRLGDAYAEFFHHYDDSPLLIINAAEINPVEREEDYQLLLEQICSVRSGKHYFNPGPLLL